jgi:competence protein ComFC
MNELIKNLTGKANYLLEDIFAFIATPRCAGCGDFLVNLRKPLCPACESNLNFPGDGPVCLICRSPQAVKCACQEQVKGYLTLLYYWGNYTDIIRQLIHQFKFDGQHNVGQYITTIAIDILVDRISAHKFDLVIPIPMLKRDKRLREFNQTELIAREVSRRLNIPMAFEILCKVKPTKLQANLGRKERWQNIKGAFEVSNSNILAGKSCLLIDDIVTTGATCLEAAQVLYSHGAVEVTVFALVSNHYEFAEAEYQTECADGII